LTINVRHVGNVAVLDLSGQLKLGDAAEFLSDTVNDVLQSGSQSLALNMAGVPFVDSSGLGMLVRVYTTVKNVGGRCILFSSPKQVLQLLRMTRLDSVLELFDDEASALASF
jgi:anti-sigma B factor antagonist